MGISYTKTKVSDTHYRFGEGNVFMDLLIGEELALLIDTGFGYGDLKAFVKTVTDKPLIVVNTHGHPDHSNGNWQFDEVYVSPLDFETAAMYDCPEGRLEGMPEEIPSDFLEEYKTAPTGNMIACNDGDIYDLGGMKIEAVALPGHTAGSTGFMNRETGELFVGDAANSSLFLFQPGISQHIDVYRATLDKIESLPVESLWLSHVPTPLDKTESVALYKRCAKDIDFEKCLRVGEMLGVKDVRLWVTEEFRDRVDMADPLKSIYEDGLFMEKGYAGILCSKAVF